MSTTQQSKARRARRQAPAQQAPAARDEPLAPVERDEPPAPVEQGGPPAPWAHSSLAVLVPYRPDNTHRERIHEYTSALWGKTGLEVHWPSDERTGPFSLSTAANRGRKMTSADAVLIYGVDQIPPPPDVLAQLMERLDGGAPWSFVYRGQQRYTPEQTYALLRGADPDEIGPPAGDISRGMSFVIAVRTDVWDELRGMDERFIGWGPEDGAWHAVLNAHRPDGNPQPFGGYCPALWHPVVATYAQTRAAGLLHWQDNYRPWLNDPRTLLRRYLARP